MTYDEMIQAWMSYHQAASAVDGHINRKTLKSNVDMRLIRVAAMAGAYAMSSYIKGLGKFMPRQNDQQWLNAKLVAVRLHEADYVSNQYEVV